MPGTVSPPQVPSLPRWQAQPHGGLGSGHIWGLCGLLVQESGQGGSWDPEVGLQEPWSLVPIPYGANLNVPGASLDSQVATDQVQP